MINKTNELSILVVEDDIETLTLLEMFLSEKFNNVYLSTTCEDAFKQYSKNSIDIIITDIKLPTKTGIEFSKEIRKIDESIPIIIVSALDQKSLILDALHVGVDYYLFKPLAYDEFSDLLDKVSKKVFLRKRLEYKNTLLIDSIEYSNEIVIILDKDYNIEYVNTRFEEILGYGKDSVKKLKFKDIISFTKHDKNFYDELVVYLSNKNLYNGFIFLEDVNGEPIYFELSTNIKVDKDGLLSHYILSAKNVHETNEINNEVKEKTSVELAQIKSLATDEIINKIAHHWRQPLSIVSALLQKIQLDLKFDTINKKNVDNSIDQTIDQINDLSKTIDFFTEKYHIEIERDMVNIDSFIKESMDFIEKYLLDMKLDLEFNLSVDEKIYIHKKHLFEILSTIIDNAKEEFELTNQENKTIVITTTEDTTNIYIEIFNNGRNIDENIKDKIFEPYFSTKHVKSGSGLSLYITKGIMEKAFKGKMSFENRDDGVSFILTIPKKANK